MTRRPGSRKDKARPPDSSNESVSAPGRGAVAVGGDVAGIASTGSNATNVQLGDVFLTVDASGLVTPAVDEDRLSRGPVVVGDVPQEPPAFQPRDDLVARLDARRAGTSIVCVVTGMRGVGKTQVAAAYARACIGAGWRLVAWVDAGDTASVLAGLGSVAVGLGMRVGSADAAGVAAMVRHWLETDGRDCLVVFDNATDLDGLRPYVPAAGAAQVVITSTRQTARNLGPAVAVDVFTEEEALAFLAARTSLSDDAGAGQLAVEMGSLPLGLAQAAAVIAQQRLGYGTYLERLRAVQLDHCLERVEGDPYPHRVAEAVMLSLEAAEAADPSGVGQGIMDLIAFLSPAGVPRALLHAAATMGVISAATELRPRAAVYGFEPSASPDVSCDAAIGRLANWSLVTFSVDGSVIAAHRLIQRIVRELRMSDGTYSGLAELAGHLLGNLGDAVGARVWEHPAEAAELAGQVTALHEHTAGHLGDTSDAARVIRSLRLWALWLVNTLGDRLAVAISIGVPLEAEFERVLGADHAETLMARNNLATAYQAAGKLDAAVFLFKRTLTDRERVLGTDHPMTLTSRNNLAGAYREAGRLDEAISLYEAALAGRERALGQADPDTLAVRSNVALTYHQAGRHDEAISVLERTLIDSERVLGGDDPRTLTLRSNLASVYLETGRVDQAVTLLAAVLNERERVQGPDHAETLTSRINLAFALQVADRGSEAISLYERALTDSERVLGADHPATLTALMHLAGTYQQAGRLEEAIPLLERAVADAERLLDPGNSRALSVRTSLAGAYQSAGRIDEAIPLFERTLADCDRRLGGDHPGTRMARANLAFAYHLAGQRDGSIAQGERLVVDNQRILGSDHPETMNSRNNLAIAYGAAGRLDQAIALLKRTLGDIEGVLGADHPDTLRPRANLARAYVDARQLNKAIPLFERTLLSNERVLGVDHPTTLTSRNDLAVAYWGAGRRKEAVSLLERTLADSERVLGAGHPFTKTARANSVAAAAEEAI